MGSRKIIAPAATLPESPHPPAGTRVRRGRNSRCENSLRCVSPLRATYEKRSWETVVLADCEQICNAATMFRRQVLLHSAHSTLTRVRLEAGGSVFWHAARTPFKGTPPRFAAEPHT